MNVFRNKKTRNVLKYIIGISLIVPVLFITYEIITSGKDSIILSVESTLYSVLILLYYGMIFIILFAWGVTEIKQVLNLKNEKVKNELKYLKTQVSPHFFFNMLNNLYGLIDKDAPKAKELVLELSEMMRYSIYKGEKEYVTLGEEITFVKNFVELQRKRYYKDLEIEFLIDVEHENKRIIPLIFINLVENAFKHGVENLRNKAYVYIRLKSEGDMVYFEVENNFDQEKEVEKEGVGLPNLTKRLDLVYANKYNLVTSSIKDVFNAQLTLYKI